MTLIIAAKGKEQGENHIIVGADSRGTIHQGDLSMANDNRKKIIELNKHVCVLIGGDVEKGSYLVNNFLPSVKKTDDVYKIANSFSNFCNKKFKPLINLLGVDSKNYPYVVFIIAGLKKDNSRYIDPRIYVLRSDDAFFLGEQDPFIVDGSNIILASYLLSKDFETESTMDDKIKLIVRCIHETSKYDGCVGGDIHVAVISEAGFTPQLESDINTIKMDIENEKMEESMEEESEEDNILDDPEKEKLDDV